MRIEVFFAFSSRTWRKMGEIRDPPLSATIQAQNLAIGKAALINHPLASRAFFLLFTNGPIFPGDTQAAASAPAHRKIVPASVRVTGSNTSRAHFHDPTLLPALLASRTAASRIHHPSLPTVRTQGNCCGNLDLLRAPVIKLELSTPGAEHSQRLPSAVSCKRGDRMARTAPG